MNCYKFLLIALPLAMILSCSSDDDSEFEQPEKKSYPIMMTATERPLADPDAPKGAPSRAPKVTTSTLDEFRVFFWGEDVITESHSHFGSSFLLKRSEDDFWGGLQNWPEGYYEEDTPENRDKKLTFYAYNYFDEDEDPDDVPNMSAEAGKAVISVVVDANSDSQTDLLAGKNIVSYNDHNGIVPMTFDHISAAVQVKLKKTSSLSNYTVNVGKVVLHHILREGEYAFDDNSWTLSEDDYADYVIAAYSDAVSQGDDDGDLEIEEGFKLLSKKGDYLFLLPQTLKGWDKNGSPKDSYIEIQCKIYNNTEGYKVGQANEYGSVYLPLGAELKMGYINKLNISMGTALRYENGERVFKSDD